jgi:hypothetical protein
MIEKKDGIDFKTEDLDKTWVSVESLKAFCKKYWTLYGQELLIKELEKKE